MEHQLSFHPRERYLLVRAKGPSDPLAAREVLAAIREKAMQGGFTRVLLDATAIAAPATASDRVLLGKAFVALIPARMRVAVLYKPEVLDKASERAAVSRGAQLLVCREIADALPWLRGSRPSVARDSHTA